MVNKPDLVVTGWLLPVLAAISVVLRVWSRRVAKAPILIDDWLIFVAQVVLMGMAAIQLYGTYAGDLGGHTQVTPEGIPVVDGPTRVVLLVQWLEEIIEKLAYGATKLSVLFFYRRVFQGHRLFDIISWTLITICILFTLSFMITVIFQCAPNYTVSWSFGSLLELETKCISTIAVLVTFCAFDVLLDLAILVQPIPLIRQLDLELSKKLTIIGIFGLGSLSLAAGIVRLAITAHEVSHAWDPITLDLTYVITPPMLWSLIEVATAVIAACLPTLGPLIYHARQHYRELSGYGSKSYNSQQVSQLRTNSGSEVSEQQLQSHKQPADLKDGGTEKASTGRIKEPPATKPVERSTILEPIGEV